ncbi:MAG: PIN domain-containing protein [Bryobacteraceae bacterium]|nr:PIN domain-containing protein [Bryobacteraceae bacterium]
MATPRGTAFFDTNLFVYTDDTSAPEKRAKAIALISEYQRLGLAVVSLQVLQEYFAAATRKLRVDPALAQRKVELMARMRVARLGEADVISAIELHRLNGISFWDALIAQAARVTGAEVLYTEDMQSGSVVAGVRVVNPFLD